MTAAAATLAPPRERVVADVDLGAVRRNCRRLREGLAPGAELCAVVKAGGYGHGAVRCAEAARLGGATWLAVASAGEAEELRAAGLPGRLLVQGALAPHEVERALAAHAELVAWEGDWVERTAAAAAASGRPARLHVKLDTGMGRLGAKDPRTARRLADHVAADPRLELAGAMTHFATADEPDDPFFGVQLERFASWAADVRAAHPGVVVHAANSAATLCERAAHFDLVRCGIAIYGLDPFGRDPADHGLEPALTLRSYVAAVKRFEPGESAGYGRRWSAERPTWVGLLPVGYGDGYRRGLSNAGEALVRGRRHPVVGTVSMDSLTVDLGPETRVRPGDEAVLIGAQDGERILCEQLADRLGTISYEVACGIAPRVPRAYAGP
jgi:alanine racemase